MARRQLGKYELIERLGRGGMAEVYKAYQPSLDRFVAIKILHPYLADDPEFKDRFEREARNVARLRHPNIVQVYDRDFDQDSESYFMVMELIEGETLKDYLLRPGNARLNTTEGLQIVRQAMEALVYAHARGMIHRDLKPANLMLENDGRVVMTDFGIARIVTGNQFTASGGMVGTPAYMAPEQGLGEVGDERSDIYSMGIILFQLATGKLPFEGETPVATILKHVNEPIPDITTFNPDIPAAVESLISRAMAKDPDERYQSAEAMLGEINAILGGAARSSSVLTPRPAGAIVSIPADSGSETIRLESVTEPKPPPGLRQQQTRSALTSVGVPALVASIVVLLGFGALIVANGGRLPLAIGAAQTETPTATLDVTFTPTTTPSLTPTATYTPTSTPTSTATATATPTDTPTPTNTPSNTPTVTPTSSPTRTPTATDTATPTPSNTATHTLTQTLTNTATSTSTATATPTRTATNTATPTATPTLTLTLTPSVTPTATFNVTATLDAATQIANNATATVRVQTLIAFEATINAQRTPTPDYTATALLCVQQYLLLSPEKPNPAAPKDPIRAGTRFEREIVLRNTSNCDWETGAFLDYLDGDQVGAPLRIDMTNTQPVKPGQEAKFLFKGLTPARGGLYTGRWRLRLAGGVFVPPPVEIAFYVFQ